jgi:MerR family transcriptional regulator, light-induced transcriptional regulator
VQIPFRSATTLPPLTSAWMRIGELSRRTGVSPELLRAWERRYGLLRPRRTDGRTRLYAAADETRVRLMQRYIIDGLAPSEAAEMVTASRLTIRPGSAASIPAADVRLAHDAMHASLDRFDETSAQRALENLFATYSPITVVRDVMVPYLREVGDRWAAGHVSVAQEHFATNFLHARLLAFARGWDRGLGPRAVLACAHGEQHTFGLVSFGVALHQLGWRITYLGADTSVAMIEEAAAHVRPDLVVVSAALPERFADVAGELTALAERWPTAIAGRGASAALTAAVGARHLDGDPVSAAHDLSVRR